MEIRREAVEKLIARAMSAREKAYAPYSRFRVGAAAMTRGGRIYTGCNVENSSYGLTCCAERVAVFKAVSEGDRDITDIALISDSKDYCSPCGACRQVLAEFGDGIRVYMCNSRGEYEVGTVGDLLPGKFSLPPGESQANE
ncbi:MAG: cytidine deaminase [Bacillota bacterium]